MEDIESFDPTSRLCTSIEVIISLIFNFSNVIVN